jgi:hypothetical protein
VFTAEKGPVGIGQKIDDGMDIRLGITANHLLQHPFRTQSTQVKKSIDKT